MRSIIYSLAARISATALSLVGICLTGLAGEIIISDTGSFSHPYSGLPADRRYVLTSTDLGGFNPAGADKLVLAFSGEKLGTFEEVSYGGVAMTQIVAVTVSTTPRNLAMFYLDNPASSGDLVVDFSSGNGVGLTVIALSNSATGYVSPPSSALTNSTGITTTNANSLVVAAAVNNAVSCPSQAPLTSLYSIDAGSAGHGSGYQKVATPGTTITPTFPSAEAVITVEFAPSPPSGTIIIVR